ncbi:RecA/RadA recombinase [Marinobacterium lacunae]|uniref:RecA/RadA recombinase n=1 Tax=Marinobacterium lacunae TaxID=1232683 RepID=A0A081FWA5_9GAMM|nr:SulA-like leucine-rich domain-containing protein [Marinobacterium lacunae]KEA62810.1 RecA/RadA recombinase [Marinobacterium lacunae]MBR9885305.1 cell division inhibitor [Oceanospirillales bacterium]
MHATALDYGTNTSSAASAAAGRVTEIIQHSDSVSLSPLLLPMLAQLSQQKRWLALVGAPSEINRAALAEAGASLERIWILRPDSRHSTVELAKRALRAETCHTVVSWHGQLDDGELGQLQQAAGGVGIQGIVVRGC